MRFSSTLTGILGLAVTCAAQTTLPSNPQASEISTGLVAAAKSVTANPSWISLDSALNSALPSTVTDVPAYLSIINEYNGGPDGVNLALLTSSISVATQSWESALPSSLKSAYDGFETSFISEAQRVEATPLGITPGSPKLRCYCCKLKRSFKFDE
ncbi:MAG: hypothetical protein M1821_007996 [Bathelium mastoideum]|nr:MAG: hypothetical protein M1821_007996 [Bathelium mastoideum]